MFYWWFCKIIQSNGVCKITYLANVTNLLGKLSFVV